ncbi:uncharacterized protein LOC131891925 [Tigriopus californicus]|uniref:uncharacterized protein LOC131891925 n=1 Tax=Tigriopus californicus TaxID=6832 RepID=UPI0027DA46B3|nr:uncharacterized protein LOC131891925 [Tigriopus californicus]
MIFKNRTLRLVTLAVLASCLVVGGEPEPRRGSKVSPKFSNKSEGNNKTVNSREGKVFSLFNIVQFNNGGCRSTSTISGGGSGSSNRNGTCFTSNECVSKGGSAAGSCAAGFGVCCVFLVSASGSIVTQNCSYIRNPNFPNSLDTATQISYTIQKCDRSVCSLRLDFETFSIQGTGNTEEIDTDLTPLDPGGVCLDTFTATVNTGQNIPTICGQNTGQHIYLDVGTLSSDTAQLNFAFNGASNNRQWEIKVTQIPCNTQGHPTGCGCLQYHTGLTGRFTSFNFAPTNDNHLANQDYSICIRQEAGFCCIEYSLCPDANSFSIDTNMMLMMAKVETECFSVDYITIEGGQGSCSGSAVPSAGVNRYCGDKLNPLTMEGENVPICDCTAPFRVDIFTDATTDLADDPPTENSKPSRGVCLEYRQIPC